MVFSLQNLSKVKQEIFNIPRANGRFLICLLTKTLNSKCLIIHTLKQIHIMMLIISRKN